MPRALPADYFYREPWRETGPLALQKYTCVECGHTSFSWDAFRMHRRSCVGQAGVTGQSVLSATGDALCCPRTPSPVAAHR